VSAPRFLVPIVDPAARVVALPDDEAHHARRVLRLSTGDPVRVFDGAGREWSGTVHEAGARQVTVTLDTEVAAVAEPPVAVRLAIGLLKGDQMDTVVREATMLGAAAILPLVSARVVAPGRARVDAARERWRRVAVQAAKQCGRAVVPTIDAPLTFDELLLDDSFDARVMLAEPATGEGAPAAPSAIPAIEAMTHPDRAPRALVLIGPEGGWTSGEVQAALAGSVHLLRLGPRTLKAETAPTVALTALWERWGW
jgi:16S rRNA (uracil1498-N3)-methyltransferase